MAYYHVKILDVVEDKDNDGNTRFRASVVEVMPRKFLVNLKDNTDAINQLTGLIGRNVMIPAKENQMNGQIYLGLIVGEPILPMPDSQPETKPVASSLPNHQSQHDATKPTAPTPAQPAKV